MDEPVIDAVQRVAGESLRDYRSGRAGPGTEQPFVYAPILGATRPHDLPEAVAAQDLHLTEDEIRSLEQP